jgi:hypothetical protein
VICFVACTIDQSGRSPLIRQNGTSRHSMEQLARLELRPFNANR